jgi:hypothetical protein
MTNSRNGYPQLKGDPARPWSDERPCPGPWCIKTVAMDTLVIEQMAMADVDIIEPDPFQNTRPDVLLYLRKLNPDLRLLAYTSPKYTSIDWHNNLPSSGDTTEFRYQFFWAVQRTGGWLGRLNKDGSACRYDPTWGWPVGSWPPADSNRVVDCYTGVENIDMAYRPTVDALVEVFRRSLLAKDRYDGLFLDGFLAGPQGPTCSTTLDTIDYKRHGFASWPAYRDSYYVVMNHYVAELRRLAPPRWLLIANAINPDTTTRFGLPPMNYYINGSCAEDFPRQNGGTWESNMVTKGDKPGYLSWESLMRQPAMFSYLAVPRPNQDSTFVGNIGLYRYMLANGALGSGVGVLTPGWSEPSNYMQGMAGYLGPGWRFDEYAVNVATGESSASSTYKHWLGKATTPPRKVPPGIWRRDFENGIVLVNPAAQALTVPLERTFQKILGTADPVVNDGSRVTEVTVPPSDAIFLLGDGVSPATPRDLRIIR